MKNNILLLLFFLVSFNITSQNLIWSNLIAGQSEDYGNGIALDPSGNVITTGSFRTMAYGSNFALVSSGWSDAFIQKLSPNGTKLWVRWYGNGNGDIGHSVITDSDGNIYVAGTFLGPVAFGSLILSSSNGNYFLIKLDPLGNVLWCKNMPGSLSSVPKLAIDSNDTLYITGVFDGAKNFGVASLNSINGKAYTAKINPITSGVIWAVQYGSGSSFNNTPVTVNITTTNIAVDSDFNVYVTGCYKDHGRFGSSNIISSATNANALYLNVNTFISKIDSSGTFIWTKTYTGQNQGTSIVVDNENNIYTSGKYFGQVLINNNVYTAPPEFYSVYFQKLNSDGQLIWFKNYDVNTPSSSDATPQLAIDDNSNIFFKCLFDNTLNFEGNLFNYLVSPGNVKKQILATFTSEGLNTWVKQCEGSNEYYFYGDIPDKSTNIAINNEGLFFTNGMSKFDNILYSSYGGANAFTAKLGIPFLKTSDFKKDISVVISPNPTSGIVHLDFDKIYSKIEIKVYNALGQKINSMNFNLINSAQFILPNEKGVFVLEISLDDKRVTKKVIKID